MCEISSLSSKITSCAFHFTKIGVNLGRYSPFLYFNIFLNKFITPNNVNWVETANLFQFNSSWKNSNPMQSSVTIATMHQILKLLAFVFSIAPSQTGMFACRHLSRWE